jgi:hypothetical protein
MPMCFGIEKPAVMRFLMLLAALSFASTVQAEPVSGLYGRLLVVVQDGNLSGVVSDQVRVAGPTVHRSFRAWRFWTVV